MPLDPITTVLGLTAMSPPNNNHILATITPTVIMPNNPYRKLLIIFNDSTAFLYVHMGNADVVSSLNYMIKIPPQGYYESPPPVFLGDWYGVWSSANGFANVTELV